MDFELPAGTRQKLIKAAEQHGTEPHALLSDLLRSFAQLPPSVQRAILERSEDAPKQVLREICRAGGPRQATRSA